MSTEIDPGILGELDPKLYNLPNGVELLDRQDTNLFLAKIPIALSDRSDVPTDEPHVENLKRLMSRESEHRTMGGQLTPGLVAQALDEDGNYQIYLCDGFHRSEALAREAFEKGEPNPTFYATLRLNCTLEDIYDLRIVSATSHKPVTFARIVTWAQKAWDLSPWGKRGVLIGQAFSLITVPKYSGERLPLTTDELGQVKEWVQDKCDLWGYAPHSIHQHLMVAQKANPRLIELTRGSGVFTQTHLRQLVEVLPLDYNLQESAANLIISQKLKSWQARIMASELANANSAEEISNILSRDWQQTQEEPRQSSHRYSNIDTGGRDYDPIQKVEKQQVEDLLDKLWEKEVEIATLKVQVAILDGRLKTSGLEEKNISPDKGPATTDEDDVSQESSITEPEIRNEIDALALRAQNGDQKAFDEIFRQTRDDINKYIFPMVGDRQLAEDFTQEVYLKAYSVLGSYEFRGNSIATWLKAIARNMVIDHYRKMGGRSIPLELEDERAMTAADEENYLDQDIFGTDPRLRHLALTELTQEQLDVLVLKYFSGTNLTNIQISKVLVTTEATVKSRLHRAINALGRAIV